MAQAVSPAATTCSPGFAAAAGAGAARRGVGLAGALPAKGSVTIAVPPPVAAPAGAPAATCVGRTRTAPASRGASAGRALWAAKAAASSPSRAAIDAGVSPACATATWPLEKLMTPRASGAGRGAAAAAAGAVSMPPISPRRSGSKLPSDPQAVSASTASMAQPVRISRLVMVLSSACLVVAGGHVWPNPSTSGTNRTCRNSS